MGSRGRCRDGAAYQEWNPAAGRIRSRQRNRGIPQTFAAFRGVLNVSYATICEHGCLATMCPECVRLSLLPMSADTPRPCACAHPLADTPNAKGVSAEYIGKNSTTASWYPPASVPPEEPQLAQYKKYRRSQVAEIADWNQGFDMTAVSISEADRLAGSPKEGDKIARNPVNHADRWLIAADYFAANFEGLGVEQTTAPDFEKLAENSPDRELWLQLRNAIIESQSRISTLTQERNEWENRSRLWSIEVARLTAENEALRGALQEISKGEGPYNREPLIHAENTIAGMKALALAALSTKDGSQ